MWNRRDWVGRGNVKPALFVVVGKAGNCAIRAAMATAAVGVTAAFSAVGLQYVERYPLGRPK
ncbi:hypothetical protein COT49_01725 [candidate division WWE3 bacterium CG08_land_8_20_14_0_20_40_13]|uniref:Uncharacterized protein n=1 Tax=candidate division WWE3 bacterium CG08_land_8_20_14_0_20_40_13 TaxID=1975084 RepID=A0A2H0XG64_UNCKA|nr:MAG: hypothetical protein COT49_01725 [candidate division WWE3 bacterium CG08_land_8_20_14_0_20_40_13]